MGEFRPKFESVLNYETQYEDIIESLTPDIEYSYAAIMNNSAMDAYFNMLSLEYYGYEYRQLLRLHKLEFKMGKNLLNLTVLEILYNIILQIEERKLAYSEYIAYDIYILPIRINKYVNAFGYKFIDFETKDKKIIKKLVSKKEKTVVQLIKEEYVNDRINNLIADYAASDVNYELRLNLWKNLFVYVEDSKLFMNKRFGETFTNYFFEKADKLNIFTSISLSESDLKYVEKTLDEVYDVTLLLLLIISEKTKQGIYQQIKEEEERKIKRLEAEKQIKNAEKTLQELGTLEITTKKNKKAK